MGIIVAYRGRFADLSRVEDFEDRLLDFALEIGGLAQIWRSGADDKPQRMIRGVILTLAPGLESTSMLLSPEGWLIGLTDIKDAEQGRLAEPPWCFTKTQFGPLEGHVALIEMLAALQREFLADLEVSDEGGYWETRDLAELARRRSFLQEAIDDLAEGLRRHGLSPEAAEDPDILIRHIERVAAQVHRVLHRPAEHPPVEFPEDDISDSEMDPDAEEALSDELFKHNRRQQERLVRDIEERQSRGETHEEAFEHALDDLALEDSGEDSEIEEPGPEDEEEPFAAGLNEFDSAPDEDVDALLGAVDEPPLLRKAMDFLQRLHAIFRDADAKLAAPLQTLFQGAGDVMGGLAQALRHRGDDDRDDYGLRITQLKRALRGAAFARGALFSLRTAVDTQQWDEMRSTLKQMEQDIFQELSRLRSERQSES